ncbi:MAG: DUF4160 domain-containing protein [Ruminococcus flavefaciens]|nr:DUF4160 domain-containing protein [Ruminococcus flavefaciens]
MGKYVREKIAGYWLYYNSDCLNEGIIHVHANEPKPIRKDSAKVWVYADGTSDVEDYGKVSEKDMKVIQHWIFDNIDLIQQEWLSNNMGGEFKTKD